jgi:hypothetical protein
VSFRDEQDALRAKNEALARELERTREELEATKRDLASAKKKDEAPPDRTPEPADEAPPERPPEPTTRGRSKGARRPWWKVYWPVFPFAATSLFTAVWILWTYSSGVTIEPRAGARIVDEECGCRAPDGTRYALEGTVLSVEPDRTMPGRPLRWSLRWELVSTAGRVELTGMGAPNGGIIGDVRYPLRFACPTNDRIVIAGGGSASAYSTADGHNLWTATVMSGLSLGTRLTEGMTVDCGSLGFDSTYVHVPVDEAPDANVRIDNGRQEY